LTLLAYSLRRAWGSLLVFLGVIWLLQFGVAHLIGASSGWKPGDTAPPSIVDRLVQFSRVAHEWDLAALEFGIAVLVVLGVIGLWRFAPKIHSFWVLVATGSVLLSFGLASFGVALANQDYRRLQLQDPATCERACIPPAIERGIARQYNRGIDPTPWWIAGGISTALGVVMLAGSITARNVSAGRKPSR
jgi:hypothetical protein